MKMSRLCLSIALLVLLGTLVAGIPGCDTSNQAKAQRPDFCLEPPYTGPCKARMIRYFYNARSGSCETFIYGGCKAKRNNFKSEEDCMRTCGDDIGPWDFCQEGRNCELEEDEGREKAIGLKNEKLGDDRALLVLLGTLVAGTPEGDDSNKDNGLRPAFCLQPPYTGPCRAMFTRYFFNAVSGLCQTFTYGGCRRKPNNFRNEKECISTCGGPNRAQLTTVQRGDGSGLDAAESSGYRGDSEEGQPTGFAGDCSE
ncbi:hypothetical protein JEQ12_004686 [Ovis aries]|uniref:BPTI/Kunitz inhibitor domain-containing protein n=1 Tax=Ovis aries TaxID=9940 RepID=A0A836A316_SHEEP|nr:hypothetical protein JEQ12_004686 [Ovis aries]